MSGWLEFTGLNRAYVLELYDKYRRDPASVDDETRALFERWTPPQTDEIQAVSATAAAPPGLPSLEKIVAAVNLAESIRRYGHLAARLDPLGCRVPVGDPSLLAETHGGEDVPLYADGPHAYLFHGVLEQHVIFHVMVEALGLVDAAGPAALGQVHDQGATR